MAAMEKFLETVSALTTIGGTGSTPGRGRTRAILMHWTASATLSWTADADYWITSIASMTNGIVVSVGVVIIHANVTTTQGVYADPNQVGRNIGVVSWGPTVCHHLLLKGQVVNANCASGADLQLILEYA